MRARHGLRLVVLVLMMLCSPWALNATVSAQTASSDIKAVVTSNDPLHPKLTLHNTSNKACQVATTADGTIAITRVEQGGKTIQPLSIDSAGDEDIGYLLHDRLKTLQPGESSDISLTVYKLSTGYILKATTWSSDAGSFSTEYAIAAKGALQLELGYALPITPPKGVPACGAVLASNVGGGQTNNLQWIGVGTAITMLALLIIIVIWLWRKRRHHRKAITTAIFLFLGLGVWWYQAPVARADVVVPSELRSVYNGCIDTFNANRDITGDILTILNDPANHFEIVHSHGVGSDMTGRRSPSGTGGIFTIYWNPDDAHRYAGTGGFPDACSVLFHELYHAFDQLRGTFSRDECAGSGIETKEVMATRAQNQLRVRLGLPPRSHYGDRALPSGDCRAPAAPTPTSCTGAHCGDTNGDPHLRTFDGLRYDFQAVGEFIAARNKSGSYEIQVRQEAWEDSRIVSLNTAVALKIGEDRVEIRAGKTLQLLINGKSRTIARAELPSGGRLDIEQGVIIFTWPDLSKAYVRSVGVYGLALSVQPSDELAGDLEGLLGDANSNSNNDLRVRGSTKTITPTHKELYPVFADSWRITDKTSLFTYDKGKNTASYTDRSFPDAEPSPKTLPGYAAAEAFCKSMGISDPAVLANCALDVAITGRPEFARAAVHSQVFAAGADFGGTTWQLNIPNTGDKASVTFEGTTGEKVFVQVVQSTLPSQCGSLKLLQPDGREFISGCIINGTGEIDGTILPATGKYTIQLSPHDSVGSATIRLLRIVDKQGVITADGPTVKAVIDKPGVVARYTFTGQMGQRIYLDVPTSTLKSQCGILRLLQPEGREIMSGCIINGKGEINTVVLPATGEFTIVIDPSDIVTGMAQLRLIAATAETKPIVMDGPTLTANLTKPGSIAQFTFTGIAGQRVYIDLPSSELPSQCGILELSGPNDSRQGSGCVINGSGNLTDDGVVLPVTGTYTIVLDPGDDATGKTTIRLRSR